MKQLDLLQEPTDHGRSDPPWQELELRGRRFRWRLWPDRVGDHWTDRRDPHHPELLYRPPPSFAFDVEFWRDGEWREVRYCDRIWEIWQIAREERPWER